MRLLERRGLVDRDESGGTADAWAEEAPALAGIAAASVQGLIAIGPRAGARVRRCGDPPEEVEGPAIGPCQARQHGFDLHAGIVAPAGHRERLETPRILITHAMGATVSYNGSMKTTIDIPDDQLREVVRNTGAATKREAVVTAIKDYNRRKRLSKLVQQFGTMKDFMTRDELQHLRRDR